MKVNGISSPPAGTDLVGYETLIRFIKRKGLLHRPGDIVEIGTFLGGGAFKLAKYLERMRSRKLIYVIDIFNIECDKTMNTENVEMSSLYERALQHFNGKSQWDIFTEVTNNCYNIRVIKGDSKGIHIPATDICFAFIDGNHDPTYVENDFYLIWNRLVPNGVIAFHDYKWDLPKVTEKIDEIILKHRSDIYNIYNNKHKHIIYITKK
ncbi:MAG: class I SAM-dependent methyltransferase [Firmicutes bacterium]|nr:class I SAM-dependent methyltransferase [Bacillota bacterium]